MFRKIAIGVSVALFTVICISCGNDKSDKARDDAADGQQVTADAIPATSQTHTATDDIGTLLVYDINGNSHYLSEWIGKQPVVMNFWGTWCSPCRREIPDLVRLYDEYHSRGIEIVSMAVNDPPSRVHDYAAKAGMQWVMLIADQPIVTAFGLTGAIPTTIFLDENGTEIERFVGMRNYRDFRPVFDKLASQS